MILTDEELQQVRHSIESQSRLDDELMQRCGHLIHLGAFDEAVRSAFVLLEERLCTVTGEEGMTGSNLANMAFNPRDGLLSKHLGKTASEREGLRELYSGAFKLFRNPTAHGVVGYDASDGKAIIGLVNLLLTMLKRAEELPPPDIFPENVETILDEVEGKIGPGAASRLKLFLGKCMKLGLRPAPSPKQLIPFRRYALVQFDRWEESKRHVIAVFYIIGQGADNTIRFPTDYYYSSVVGFNVDRLTEELIDLGFVPEGKNQEPCANLRLHNSEEFFEALFDIVVRASDELEETLNQS